MNSAVQLISSTYGPFKGLTVAIAGIEQGRAELTRTAIMDRIGSLQINEEITSEQADRLRQEVAAHEDLLQDARSYVKRFFDIDEEIIERYFGSRDVLIKVLQQLGEKRTNPRLVPCFCGATAILPHYSIKYEKSSGVPGEAGRQISVESVRSDSKKLLIRGLITEEEREELIAKARELGLPDDSSGVDPDVLGRFMRPRPLGEIFASLESIRSIVVEL